MIEFGIPDALVLEGDIKKNYESFAENFLKYIDSMGLQEEKAKKALFFSTIGKEARELCKSLDLPSSLTLREIMDRFRSFSVSYKDNILYYSYEFHNLIQDENETFSEFLKKIYPLADKCNFNDKDRMLIDQIIFGLKDQQLRKEIFIQGYQQLDQVISFCLKNENKNGSGIPVISQSLIVIKTEKIDEIPEKRTDGMESGNQKNKHSNETVTSSQEQISVLINEETVGYDDVADWDDDFCVLEKGEVSTSTSTANNFSNMFSHSMIKKENEEPLQPKNNGNLQGTVREGRLSPKDMQNNSSVEIIDIDFSDDEDVNDRERNPENSPETQNNVKVTKPVLDPHQLQNRKIQETIPKHKCWKCSEKFENLHKLRSHIQICLLDLLKKDVKENNSGSASTSTQGNIPVNSAQKIIKNVYNSKKRIGEKDRPKTIKCPKCEKGFVFVCRLKKHLEKGCTGRKKEKSGKSLYICGKCRKTFAQKTIFMRHLKFHEKKNSSQRPNVIKKSNSKCTVCQKSFSQKGNMLRHYEAVHLNRNLKITSQNPTIKTVQNKDPHIFPCRLCPSKYSHNRSLTSHMKKRHSSSGNGSYTDQKEEEKRKLYPCTTCFKKFNDLKQLEAHKAIHQNNILTTPSFSISGDLSYECGICRQKFDKSEKQKYEIHFQDHFK